MHGASIGGGDGARGELVSQQTEPGGIATADICVLDDITRAPGEALNALLRCAAPLLPAALAVFPERRHELWEVVIASAWPCWCRLLNERKTADGATIPLCTAIATANPVPLPICLVLPLFASFLPRAHSLSLSLCVCVCVCV
eukprot:COSAG01_NODE_4348_length_5116_cov_1.582220_6_plen_143_part_00